MRWRDAGCEESAKYCLRSLRLHFSDDTRATEDLIVLRGCSIFAMFVQQNAVWIIWIIFMRKLFHDDQHEETRINTITSQRLR